MKQSRNSVTVILMISSIVLLLVLQVFWLRGAYRNADEHFRKETNSLFRTTIVAMHDSLIQQSLEPVEKDSLMKFMKPRRYRFDTVVSDGEPPPPDSLFNYMGVVEKGTRIEISSTLDRRDSIGRILRPLITKMHMGKEPRHFILRLGPDSLKLDSIEVHFKQALDKAGIQAAFEVLSIKNEKNEKVERTTVRPNRFYTSEVVRLNPITRYAVSFAGIEGLLLKEITPQILFSLFLTLLTIGSFYIMYRNLRSQQRLMQIKNDFISNITHELKTPVATVSVALEALRNFRALDNPQRTTEYLEIAQNELNRLTLMTDKILKTSVYEDNGVALEVKPLDVDALVQQVLASMKLVFEKRKIVLSYQKEGTDFTVDGSEEHLTNVLYNLLDNALKYSGETSSIHIYLKSTSGNIRLSVKDTGIGIAREYQKKIFEKFFRVPSGDIHNTKGYGLGLSYVASVVKSHTGEISVESEPGKGSCFIIILPKRHEN